MALADDLHLTMLIADYIGVDAGGKLNAIGAGITVTGLQPNGLSAPHHVAVLMDAPSKYYGTQFAFSLELRDQETNQLVQVPNPSGTMEALRIQQVLTVSAPFIQNVYLPPGMVARVQVSLAFPTGVPVQAGATYGWHVQIDGREGKGWYAQFHVPGPPPPPVVGGPYSPANIPGLTPSAE